MCLDGRSLYFHKLRLRLNIIAAPLQYVVALPFNIYDWASDSLVARNLLITQNQSLTARNMFLGSKLEKLRALEAENSQLKAMLSSSADINEKISMAQLLAIDLDNRQQVVVLRKGSADGVYVGQPVVDAYGVFGQIIDVGPSLAKVMLITDKDSRIPVVDQRTGMRSIAEGLGSSQKLSLINVLRQADIKVGDIFVSSGLALLYPAGYPVAQVVAVNPVADSGFKQVIMRPLAHLERSTQVLLVWHQQKKLRAAVHKILGASTIQINSNRNSISRARPGGADVS